MIFGNEDYLKGNFERVEGGWIAYKTFGMFYDIPESWKLEKDFWIDEDLDIDTFEGCSYGINVGPSLDWLREFVELEDVKSDWYDNLSSQIWKVFIPDDAHIVIPRRTGGKIRADRMQLLDVVSTLLYQNHPDYELPEGFEED